MAIERAKDAGHAADVAFAGADAVFHIAVGGLGLHGFRALRNQDVFAAAGDADIGIGEVAQKLAQRLFVDHHVGVGEDDHLRAGFLDEPVQHAGLAAAAGQFHQAQAVIEEAAHDFVGTVGGAVGADQDLQLARLVVEIEGVGDLLADDLLFIIRGNEHCGRGPVPRRHFRRHGKAAAEEAQRERVEHVGVEHAEQAQPEEDGNEEEGKAHGGKR